MFDQTDQLSDAELTHYLRELARQREEVDEVYAARIESESSADEDALIYGWSY